jgi:ribosome production factor 2
MAKREPQQNENPKTTLFVTGQRTSQILKLAVADLSTLKRPFCERFTKKNDIHPFDDASCTFKSRQPSIARSLYDRIH